MMMVMRFETRVAHMSTTHACRVTHHSCFSALGKVFNQSWAPGGYQVTRKLLDRLTPLTVNDCSEPLKALGRFKAPHLKTWQTQHQYHQWQQTLHTASSHQSTEDWERCYSFHGERLGLKPLNPFKYPCLRLKPSNSHHSPM